MPVENRPVVGTLNCDECGETASLHQTARGKRRLLYRRCGCGCDQRTGEAIQKHWRQNMTPRPGFEHLAEPKPEPEQPNKTAPVLESVEPKPEPKQPTQQPKQEPKPEPEKGSMAVPFWASVLIGTAVFIAKTARGGA